jgi:hypothetical protein
MKILSCLFLKSWIRSYPLPLDNLKISFPLPPINLSFPIPPHKVSFPEPPEILSFPAYPHKLSLAFPPIMVSFFFNNLLINLLAFLGLEDAFAASPIVKLTPVSNSLILLLK